MVLRRRPSRAFLIAVALGAAAGLLLSLGGGTSDASARTSTDAHCTAAVEADSATCPILSTSYGSEPGGWSRAANSAWTTDGKPVFFFYSSLACPYCASSSWVLWFALAQFGNWTGLAYAQSMPSPQVYPNTSSLDFSNATYSSNWVVTDFWVGTSTTSIQLPNLTCPESAYYTSYDAGGSVPFFVINGQFFEIGTLSQPQAFRENTSNSSSSALSAGAVRGEFENESGPAWTNSTYQIGLVEAAIVIADGGRGPAPVLANSTVQRDIQNMTAPPPASFPWYEVIAGSGLGAVVTYFGAAVVVRRRASSKEEEAAARNPFRVASITLTVHGQHAPGEPAHAGASTREGGSGLGSSRTPSSEAADDSMADLV
jgi:Domain of unknown function (DUF929)